MLELTKHFVENWRKRVGHVPRADEVRRMINQAVRIQKGRRIYGRTSWIKTLSIYWHTGTDLIITVDHFTDKVVSVYSRDMEWNSPIGQVMEV